MPRSHRRRPDPSPDVALDRLIAGWKRTELRRGAQWTVQPVSAVQALKAYTCPGCARMIEPGVAHLVAWRADGVLGDAAALADRRHWHPQCWRIG
ncbi:MULTISPECIES: hypothetical protein [unclassified Microbacterium]|uniref:hypothetical protein n=1 Tax=unclassified Microbacterium TaxID=2609290 RepID=UPI00214C57D1|nr:MULTISPECIES: hypothetical protein [unclassified Microbacterium]MCR2785453.1 hypothetical protein [Microbacterium sp. zg.B96]MDL5350423.1 hypothetical protein [Microbacterium sp. zg-YB36]WIM14521.1 hypothetical protein QNO11_07990 [Microbacterium sp. zg-B96]